MGLGKELTIMNRYSKICGEQIKKLREYKRLSLRQLADLSNISYTAIRNYEMGERSMDIDQIDILCHALNKDTKEFLDECFEIAMRFNI